MSNILIHQQWTHLGKIQGKQYYSSIQYNSQKIKYLGINLAKQVRSVYNENHRTLKQEMEESIRK